MGASRIAIYPVPLSRAAGAAGGVDAVSIVLDVGWGEGLFTRYLTGVAASVVGIDLSETAIARARGSVPQVEFHCVSVQEYAPRQRFDDVVAAGMLYDADDLEQALDSLRALANVIVVSYARARAPQIERRLRHAGHVTSTFHSLFQSKKHGFTIASFGARAGGGATQAFSDSARGSLGAPGLSAADSLS